MAAPALPPGGRRPRGLGDPCACAPGSSPRPLSQGDDPLEPPRAGCAGESPTPAWLAPAKAQPSAWLAPAGAQRLRLASRAGAQRLRLASRAGAQRLARLRRETTAPSRYVRLRWAPSVKEKH